MNISKSSANSKWKIPILDSKPKNYKNNSAYSETASKIAGGKKKTSSIASQHKNSNTNPQLTNRAALSQFDKIIHKDLPKLTS